MGYSYFPDVRGEHAASGPLKHEVLICNSINSKNAALSWSKMKFKNVKNSWISLSADFLQLYNLSASIIPSLFWTHLYRW